MSRQLVPAEMIRFLDERKPLRVSSPQGMQRSSYFLSLPLRYSMPLMGLLISMHWLVSQYVFVVQTRVYGPGPGGTRLAELDRSKVGYSPIGIFATSCIGIALMLLITANSAFRAYTSAPPWLVRQATNSMLISALSQRPDGDVDARFFPIRLGAVCEDLTPGVDGTERIAFSTDTKIRRPVEKMMVCQPVFS